MMDKLKVWTLVDIEIIWGYLLLLTSIKIVII
jgi:hypothetical protein